MDFDACVYAFFFFCPMYFFINLKEALFDLVVWSFFVYFFGVSRPARNIGEILKKNYQR